MNDQSHSLTQARIARFWLPLAITWLMISVEGPFIAAVIARLGDPKPQLAAFGVAFALAMLFESPIILIMSASTALVVDRDSLRKLRRFTYGLNALITLALAVLVVPAVFRSFATGLIGLSPDVADIARRACTVMLPWPAAIGYRRFYQGILIRNGRTRRVAYGTVIRLSSMAGTALVLRGFGWPGAIVGAGALAAGVIAEAAASRVMARDLVRRLLADEFTSPRAPLTYGYIWHFYLPLALTSVLTLGVNPVVTFFLGKSVLALESLAVMPVINPLVFLFGSVGLAFQEVGIALVGQDPSHYPALRRFATTLGLCAMAGLAAVACTPLRHGWLAGMSGLTPDLESVATLPILLLMPMPALSVLLAFQRAMLVAAHTTRPITWATAIEVTGIVIALYVGVHVMGWVGATAAAGSFLVGRIGAISYLVAVRRARSGARALADTATS